MRHASPHRMLPLALACLAACGERNVEIADERATGASQATDAVPVSHEARTIDRGDGCVVEVLTEGSGRALEAGDEALFSYVARTQGAEAPFASTRDWPEPCRAELGPHARPPLISGLVRGLIGLRVGTKARITIPPALAYGSAGLPAAGIPADTTLEFEVEILGVH